MSGANDLTLEVRELEYIFSTVKDYELQDFSRDSLENADGLKQNNKLFYVLYKQVFSLTSKGSQTIVSLKDFPFSFTTLPPLVVKDDPVINEAYYKSLAKRKDLEGSSFYFDLFAREWDRWIHVYTESTLNVIDYSFPREQKIFSLWINFDYSIERNGDDYEQKLDFNVDFRKQSDLTIQQFIVYQNIFGKSNQKCMIVEFKYKTDLDEIKKFVKNADEFDMPKKIKTQFMYNPNGKVIDNDNIEARLSKVNPATLLTIDTSKNPAEMKLSNVDFLRNTTVPFQIYVIVTKNKRVYREGTISYVPGKTKIEKSTDTVDAITNNLVIHKKTQDSDDNDKTKEDSSKSRLIIRK